MMGTSEESSFSHVIAYIVNANINLISGSQTERDKVQANNFTLSFRLLKGKYYYSPPVWPDKHKIQLFSIVSRIYINRNIK